MDSAGQVIQASTQRSAVTSLKVEPLQLHSLWRTPPSLKVEALQLHSQMENPYCSCKLTVLLLDPTVNMDYPGAFMALLTSDCIFKWPLPRPLQVNMRDAKGASFKVEKGYIEKDREKNPFYDPRSVSSSCPRTLHPFYDLLHTPAARTRLEPLLLRPSASKSCPHLP